MPRPVVFDGQRLPASYANFLVANAAVLGARVPLAQYPLEAWIRTFQVNVHANLLLLQGLDALLRKSDAGRVIFLSAASAPSVVGSK